MSDVVRSRIARDYLSTYYIFIFGKLLGRTRQFIYLFFVYLSVGFSKMQDHAMLFWLSDSEIGNQSASEPPRTKVRGHMRPCLAHQIGQFHIFERETEGNCKMG